MKRTLKEIIGAALLAVAWSWGTAQDASAVPITGLPGEDPRCDVLSTQTLTHELGQVGFFPGNEAIVINSVTQAGFTVCVPDDGVANDWIVDMINVSGQAWTNLHFVSNLNGLVGNADGSVIDVIGAPAVKTDAFRIDALGINPNLLGESMIADGIFAVGESWRFTVSNFSNTTGGILTPFFRTPGLFAGSAPLNAALPDSASILATPVPEPAAAAFAGIIIAALTLYRPRRR